jgi:hypothetical protein
MVANSQAPRSLAWSQLPVCPLPSPHPRAHFPPKGHLFTHYLHTDDINMPAASVRHKNDCHTRLKRTNSGLSSESIMRRRTSENKKSSAMSAIFQLKVNVSKLCQRKMTDNCLVYLDMTERRHAKYCNSYKIKKTD